MRGKSKRVAGVIRHQRYLIDNQRTPPEKVPERSEIRNGDRKWEMYSSVLRRRVVFFNGKAEKKRDNDIFGWGICVNSGCIVWKSEVL